MKNVFYFIFISFNLFSQDSILGTFNQDQDQENTRKSFFSKRLFSVYTEEDVWPILVDSNLALDQNYTMGFGFRWSEGKDKCYVTRLRRFINKVNYKYLCGKDSLDYTFEDANPPYDDFKGLLSINGSAFTPDSLQKYDISYNDRPYSFLLTYQSSQTYISENFTSAKTYSLSLGCFGLRIGEIVQTKIHEPINNNDTEDPHTPRGWTHQISDGFEPTLMYSVINSYLLTKNAINLKQSRSYFDLSFSREVLLGYYTGAVFELYSRVGFLDSRNWLDRYNSLSNANKAPTEWFEQKRKWEVYFYAGIKPSVILYNEALTGGFRHSDYRLKPIAEANPFILELYTGIGVNIPCHDGYFNFSWSPFALRTAEMWGSKISRTHYWGGLFFNFMFM